MDAVPASNYEDALNGFLEALGVDSETAFALEVEPHRAVIKHVVYTQKENGNLSGDFWTEVISRGTTDGQDD